MSKHLDHLQRLHRKLHLRYGVQDLEHAIREQRERELAAHDEKRQERRGWTGQMPDRGSVLPPTRQASGLADLNTFLMAARRGLLRGSGADQTH